MLSCCILYLLYNTHHWVGLNGYAIIHKLNLSLVPPAETKSSPWVHLKVFDPLKVTAEETTYKLSKLSYLSYCNSTQYKPQLMLLAVYLAVTVKQLQEVLCLNGNKQIGFHDSFVFQHYFVHMTHCAQRVYIFAGKWWCWPACASVQQDPSGSIAGWTKDAFPLFNQVKVLLRLKSIFQKRPITEGSIKTYRQTVVHDTKEH